MKKQNAKRAASKPRPRIQRKPVVNTIPVQPVPVGNKAKNKWLWWVAGIGGITLWLLLSSFTTKKAAGADTDNSDTGTSDSEKPCKDNWMCRRGYWAWELLKTVAGQKAMKIKARDMDQTIEKTVYTEAEASISKTPTNMAEWEALINSIIEKIKSNTAWYQNVTQKAESSQVSINEQLRLDAIWVIIDDLIQKAGKIPLVTVKTNDKKDQQASISGFQYYNIM